MMNRRNFLKSAVAAGMATTFPLSRVLASGGRVVSTIPEAIPALSLERAPISFTRAAIRELGERINGALILSGDERYDATRRIWNGMHDRRPALIVRCASEQDVVRAVEFVRDHGALSSVRCGGHSFPGKSVADGAVMIDLAGMNQVRVDAQRRRARVAGGALLYNLDHAAQKHGLATTTGVVSHTGVGGLTLGGGFGRLNRKYGLTIDNLLSARIVTPDGRVRRLGPDNEPELFWAIRGGGGNFGIVTEFEFRLHETGTRMLAGNLVWPMSRAREVMDYYAEWSEGLSDELYTGPTIAYGPDGNPAFSIEACYCGDMAAGERELAPLRALKPLMDDVASKRYLDVQTGFDAAAAHGARYYIKNGMLAEFTPELVDALLRAFPGRPELMLSTHTAGGMMNRIAPDATAWPHRNANTMMLIFAGWRDPADDETVIGSLKQWWSEIEPHTVGSYANLQADTSRAERAFGPNHDRLLAVKRQFDPGNLFRLNTNIDPAG